MKITFLGTGTSTGIPTIGVNRESCFSDDPKDNRLRSSILIECDNKNFVVDCGPDFRQQMLRTKTTRVDAILFTHEHADHTAGLDDVRPISFKHGKIPIYAHTRVVKNLKKRFDYLFDKKNDYPGSPHVYPIIIENKKFNIEEIEILPITYMHHKLQVFGFRIKNFAYVTDLKMITKEELNKLKNLDVLILNSLRHNEHYSHINLTQAIDHIEELKPKKAFLTHIAPDMGLHSETEKILPKSVFLAFDGLEIIVDD
tara:strand:+ start:1575 stop:2342 length:768 start_codon:yes stop_codon:yes gene_type:complete